MSEDTYNGWRNYATWRINLEIAPDVLDGRGRVTAEELKDEVEELVVGDAEGILVDYALAFMSDVDWYEIAEHHNSDLPDDEDDDADDEEDDEA